MVPLRSHLSPVRESNISAERDPRRLHLQRVLASETFARAHQLRSLLNWLGHQALTEDSRVPSEREVAEAVMRRGNFDPQTDSLVRKEMGRLRDKLTKYYASEDTKDGLRITLPAGYRVRFEDTTAPPRAGAAHVLWLPFRAATEDRETAHALWEDLLLLLSAKVAVVPPSRALAIAQQGAAAGAEASAAAFVLEGRYRSQPSLSLAVWITRADAWRVESATQFDAAAADLNDAVVRWVASIIQPAAPLRSRSHALPPENESAFPIQRGA